MEFVIGGMAAVGAGFFTNPLEVIKTRMQLQGELRARGQHAVYYKNVFHAGYMVAKHDGLLALQNGLAPALWVQLVLNGIRLGTYQTLDDLQFMTDKNGQRIISRNILAAGLSGMLGQYICTPLFLIKTHQQSNASSKIAVGHQHGKKGLTQSLIALYDKNGVRGLFRNATAGFPRAFVGCSAQLTTFEYSKDQIRQFQSLHNKPLLVSFLGSMIGGISISILMTPFDLIMTRLYNQPVDKMGKGQIYANYFDCVRKIYKSEGLPAFYKGVGPMYLRLGPHTVLCLVFWDQLKILHANFRHQSVVN